MSYTKEMTQRMVAEYTANPTRETVNALAEEFEKSAKSVIGKLSREGVYQRETYKTKAGSDPVTKAELVADIVALLGVEDWRLHGLEKAPKGVLQTLKDSLNEGME